MGVLWERFVPCFFLGGRGCVFVILYIFEVMKICGVSFGGDFFVNFIFLGGRVGEGEGGRGVFCFCLFKTFCL